MLPAAFTPYTGGYVGGFDASCVPLISVGALNPDSTIALFSNAGDWVRCHRPGAALVSTFPETFNASEQPSIRVKMPDGSIRATIDLDDFSGGFGTWSGTSFSAPILGGQIAQELVGGSCGSLDALDSASSVSRSWAALTNLVEISP
jgi:subtilisin family serine protease